MLKILSILTTLIFFGCSIHSPQYYPTWFHESQKDDLFLFGKGSGTSFLIAKEQAILDISTQMSITISSTEQSSKNINLRNTNAITYETNSQDIVLSVNPLNFQNIDVVKSDSNSGVFFVLVKIKISDFKKHLLDHVFKELEKINTANNKHYNNNIELYNEYKNLESSILEVKSSLAFVSFFDKKLANDILVSLNLADKMAINSNADILFSEVSVADNLPQQNTPILTKHLINKTSSHKLSITVFTTFKKLFGKDVAFTKMSLVFSDKTHIYTKNFIFSNQASTQSKATEQNYQTINQRLTSINGATFELSKL